MLGPASHTLETPRSRLIAPPTLIGTGIDPGTAVPIDTEAAYPRPFRASWTLSPDRTMMRSNPELGRCHEHRGLAVEPGPREVRGGLQKRI